MGSKRQEAGSGGYNIIRCNYEQKLKIDVSMKKIAEISTIIRRSIKDSNTPRSGIALKRRLL